MGALPGVDGPGRRAVDPGPRPRPTRRGTIRFADGRTLGSHDRTAVMGILNVTPDSFSDGGAYPDVDAALRAALAMVAGGADLIDVGGESTRPGARPVEAEAESRRVDPVIAAIRRECPVRISVDTSKAAVARRALDAGADMLNDVTALADPAMLPLIRRRNVPVVLMHMRGTPETMQRNTRYEDLIGDVVGFLRERVEQAAAAGIADDKILVDPGIGFGKSPQGNLAILRRLPALDAVGRPILIGASRKAFIGSVLDVPLDDRLEGSLAVAAFASAQGADVVRVHDVTETVRVVRMIDAITRGR